MTSANVFHCTSANQSQTINAKAATGKAKAENQEAASVFSSMMNVSYSTTPVVSDNGDKDLSLNAKNADIAASGNDYERYQYQDREINTADEYSIAEKVNESSEKLDSFKEEMLQTVAQDLGVDTETLTAVLEELGLTAFDLLDPQNLAQMAMCLNAESAPADLLLNSQFVDLMQDVGDMGTQLMNELDLAPEQMEKLVAQMHILEQPEEFSEVPEVLVQNTEGVSVMTEPVTTVDQKVQSPNEQTPVEEEMTPLTEPEEKHIVSDASMMDGREEQPEKQMEEQQEEPDSFMSSEKHTVKSVNTVRETQQLADAAFAVNEMVEQEIVQTTPVADHSYLSIDTMDLIEQIAEQVRVNISEGTSSMEMQLNPENLGKIYLQVSVKEGNINATIAAQNEAVKAALEVQIADLRESLNQAGVKVDAVEVTIASHEFEKNLEQDQNREKQQGERQQEMSHRRNINMSSLDELSSVMTEEEALVAQMMRDNGNSVDLTA